MANDVSTVSTINNATILPVVTNAALGSVDLSCVSDVATGRGDKNVD